MCLLLELLEVDGEFAVCARHGGWCESCENPLLHREIPAKAGSFSPLTPSIICSPRPAAPGFLGYLVAPSGALVLVSRHA